VLSQASLSCDAEPDGSLGGCDGEGPWLTPDDVYDYSGSLGPCPVDCTAHGLGNDGTLWLSLGVRYPGYVAFIGSPSAVFEGGVVQVGDNVAAAIRPDREWFVVPLSECEAGNHPNPDAALACARWANRGAPLAFQEYRNRGYPLAQDILPVDSPPTWVLLICAFGAVSLTARSVRRTGPPHIGSTNRPCPASVQCPSLLTQDAP
jgi:hypothetical protein